MYTFIHFNKIVSFLCIFLVLLTEADDNEHRLVRDLMRTYDKRIRPSKNASHALNVTFGLALSQIIDVVCSVLVIVILSGMFHRAQYINGCC